MKTFKKILIPVFFALTVSLYWGMGVVDSYSHIKSNIETTTNSPDTQSLGASESSFEDDLPVIFTDSSIQVINSGCETITSATCFFPLSLHYSIWQPPKIS